MPELSSGLYIHVPFCLSKCRYCDFVSFPGRENLWRSYLDALLGEIAALAVLPRTLFVGGGTPTVWPSDYLVALMRAAIEAGLPETAEASVEANPGTLDGGKLERLRAAGYNRLSIGVQSTDDDNLRLLGRCHTYGQAKEAVRLARAAGFTNVSVDLIYGLPGQRVGEWREDLQRALALESDHVSAYALSLEAGTSLAQSVSSGELAEPNEDAVAEMYEACEELLASAGYAHYEISNWARLSEQDRQLYKQSVSQHPCSMQKSGALSSPLGKRHQGAEPEMLALEKTLSPEDLVFSCKHNLIYWHAEPYVGLGAGAHSFIGGKRFARVSDPIAYIKGDPNSRIVFSELIDERLGMAEMAILGLRLTFGLDRRRFCARFGVDPVGVYRQTFERARALGLVEIENAVVRLTRRGRLLSNEVFLDILPD